MVPLVVAICYSAQPLFPLFNYHNGILFVLSAPLMYMHSYLSAWTLMGHEYMELRNTAAAVQCYRNAVGISEVITYGDHAPHC